MTWPTVDLDPVARLRVLSRVLPGVALEERTLRAPFDEVWDFVSDLPNSVPQFDSDVSSIDILERHGDHLKIISRPPYLHIPFRVDVELRRGWCWMASRPQIYIVGMAAVPDGEHTRFAMLEGFSVPSGPAFRSLLAPVHAVSAWRHRHHLPHDADGIERALNLR
jgi:hypothetical protein